MWREWRGDLSAGLGQRFPQQGTTVTRPRSTGDLHTMQGLGGMCGAEREEDFTPV